MWRYDEGNYNDIRTNLNHTDWSLQKDLDINIYAANISEYIVKLAVEYIPNKLVRIRTADPPWFHNELRKLIRKRKRAHRKAKLTNTPVHWSSYRKLRNETTTALRGARTHYFRKLSDRLKSGELTNKDWWKTFKLFQGDNSSSIPPLVHNDIVIIGERPDREKCLI